MTESIQNWVLKGADIDKEWPEYIENLNRMGLSEVLEVMQEAYERREKQQVKRNETLNKLNSIFFILHLDLFI